MCGGLEMWGVNSRRRGRTHNHNELQPNTKMTQFWEEYDSFTNCSWCFNVFDHSSHQRLWRPSSLSLGRYNSFIFQGLSEKVEHWQPEVLEALDVEEGRVRILAQHFNVGRAVDESIAQHFVDEGRVSTTHPCTTRAKTTLLNTHVSLTTANHNLLLLQLGLSSIWTYRDIDRWPCKISISRYLFAAIFYIDIFLLFDHVCGISEFV